MKSLKKLLNNIKDKAYDTFVRDKVIEITLPDGQNWFLGVVKFHTTYANRWTTVLPDLVQGQGIWTEREAIQYVRIIATEGCTIRAYSEVRFEQELKNKQHGEANIPG